jgi:hypothetical protein
MQYNNTLREARANSRCRDTKKLASQQQKRWFFAAAQEPCIHNFPLAAQLGKHAKFTRKRYHPPFRENRLEPGLWNAPSNGLIRIA